MVKAGFIGLGIMGFGMAYNLARKGLLAGVYNRTGARSREFLARLEKEGLGGVKLASTPKELAGQVDVVLTCVSNDQAMDSIVFGRDGLLSGMSRGKILMDSSTTSSSQTAKMEKALAGKGARLVAAPMTGSRLRAHNGTLTFMVGGNKAAAYSLKPLFGAMGERAVYLGSAESAQDFKVLANQYQSDKLVSYAFKILAGLEAGAPMAGMQEVFDNTAALSGVAKFKAGFIVAGDFGDTHDKVHFELDLMLKDLRLAKQLRTRLGMVDPIADQTLKLFEQAPKEGHGRRDFAAIVDFIQNSPRYNPKGKRITGQSLTDAQLISGEKSRK